MKAPVLYIPRCVEAGPHHPDKVMKVLQEEVAWERRGSTPRSEAYFNDHDVPYLYGKGAGARTYYPRRMPEIILPIREALEKITGAVLDVCFMNRYLNLKDHLGWHADDSPEMDPARPIVTVSLGAAREIWFRPKLGFDEPGLASDIEKLLLEHGSAAIMQPGMQQEWEHRIPKADRVVGERISLTFRGYKES